MSFLNIFFNRSRHPMLRKFQGATNLKFKEVYYCFGFEYSIENLSLFKAYLNQNELFKAKEVLKYNVKENNVEVFLVKNNNHNLSIITILDFYEPLFKDKIIEQVSISEMPKIEIERLK